MWVTVISFTGMSDSLIFLLQELYQPVLGQFVAGIGLLRGSLADPSLHTVHCAGEVAVSAFLLFLQSRMRFLIFSGSA